MGLRRSI